VAVAFAVTGTLSLVVRQIDQRRSEREAWHAVLHDLVAANQKVEMVRLRLLAHRSAKTLLLPKTSSMLVGADARVWPMWPMLCAMAACGAFVRQGNAVAW
jgi:hypothetical protein